MNLFNNKGWWNNGEGINYSREDVEKVLSSWTYDDPKKQAKITIDKYGMPDEMTNDRLIWYERGPWKRIEIQDTHLLHNFPIPHYDFTSHVARYKVNPDKASDRFKCDGSIIVEETAGEIGSRCHFEGANMIATNMIYEIMEGKRDWRDAQRFMYEAIANNKNVEYVDRLVFKPLSEKEANNPRGHIKIWRKYRLIDTERAFIATVLDYFIWPSRHSKSLR